MYGIDQSKSLIKEMQANEKNGNTDMGTAEINMTKDNRVRRKKGQRWVLNHESRVSDSME